MSSASDDGWSSSESSASGSTSRSPSPSPSTSASAPASTSGAAPEVRKRHGEKLRYEAPEDFSPATFSSSTFSFRDFASDNENKKELWAIKVPASVEMASLDGLSVPLSSLTPHNPSSRNISAKVKGAGARRYTLRSNAAAGNAEDAQNGEMASMLVLMPDTDAGAGRYSLLRRGIDRNLHFALDVEDNDPKVEVKDEAEEELESAGTKRKQREQPWHKLKGYFHPAGASLSKALDEQVQEEAKPAVAESQDSTTSSPRKKKARKSNE